MKPAQHRSRGFGQAGGIAVEKGHELDAVGVGASRLASLERFAFYTAARASFAVVQVGDPRFYGCFLIRKGVIGGPAPTLP